MENHTTKEETTQESWSAIVIMWKNFRIGAMTRYHVRNGWFWPEFCWIILVAATELF